MIRVWGGACIRMEVVQFKELQLKLLAWFDGVWGPGVHGRPCHPGTLRGRTERRCDFWIFQRLGGKGLGPAFHLFDMQGGRKWSMCKGMSSNWSRGGLKPQKTVLWVRGEARWAIREKIYFCRQRIRYGTLSLGIKRIATSRLLLCKLAGGILSIFVYKLLCYNPFRWFPRRLF